MRRAAQSLPRERSPDSTLALAGDPYRFIAKRCEHHGADAFQARILLRPTICMRGREAAKLFYDQDRFIRHEAMPRPIVKTLLGSGGVQTLDASEHRHRKQMFMSIMTPDRIADLTRRVDGEWRAAVRERWSSEDRVVLYDGTHEPLTRAVCAWAGVPLAEDEVPRRTRDLTALFDHAGNIGPAHFGARLARRRANRWMAEFVNEVRAGRFPLSDESPAAIVIGHRDLGGALLPPDVAAVELLNILRPTVAVSVFITFVALALHEHPECRRKVESGEEDEIYLDLFVNEVRRFYPFFPAVAARVREDFEWRGYHFPKGRRVLLDLYGTDHDARVWADPGAFRPERLRRDRPACPFAMIPQGGGEHHVHHRCPGEWITIDLMKHAARFLTRELQYEVPEQDLKIDMARLPALPASRFVMASVRLRRPPEPQPNAGPGAAAGADSA